MGADGSFLFFFDEDATDESEDDAELGLLTSDAGGDDSGELDVDVTVDVDTEVE